MTNKVSKAKKRLKRKINLNRDKWQYFITLTFDPKKVRSNDSIDVVYYLKLFFNNLNRISKKLKINYDLVLIPDFASDEQGIHFHGLIWASDVNLLLNLYNSRFKNVYNTKLWSYGFTTLFKLYEVGDRLVNYIIKYVFKFYSNLGMLLPKYYYYSSNLIKYENYKLF